MLDVDREKNAVKDSRGPWREWETDGYGVVQWSSERCDGTRRQGRMSPGRQRWGFRAWDGSALKNTSVPLLPACAPLPLKLLLSPPSVVYTLHLISLFPRPLLSIPSSLNFLIISPPLCPLFCSLLMELAQVHSILVHPKKPFILTFLSLFCLWKEKLQRFSDL